jgi:CRP-like cAMP-binding protein
MSLKEIISILQINSAHRLKSDVAKLQKYLAINPFIAGEVQKLKNDPDMLQLLFQSLKVDEQAKGSFVFNYGDEGSTFYIILSGEVQIRVPTPVELEGDSATPEGLLVFLVTYFEIICWDKI